MYKVDKLGFTSTCAYADYFSIIQSKICFLISLIFYMLCYIEDDITILVQFIDFLISFCSFDIF